MATINLTDGELLVLKTLEFTKQDREMYEEFSLGDSFNTLESKIINAKFDDKTFPYNYYRKG